MKTFHVLVQFSGGLVMIWGLWHWGSWPGLCLGLACYAVTGLTNAMANPPRTS